MKFSPKQMRSDYVITKSHTSSVHATPVFNKTMLRELTPRRSSLERKEKLPRIPIARLKFEAFPIKLICYTATSG